MKKFVSTFDGVLKVKRQLEKLADMKQQRARVEVEKARAAVQALRDQLARVADHMAATVGRAMTPTAWLAASDVTDRIGHAIRAAEQEVAAAEQRLQAAAAERTRIATEVEAMSTLRQQQFDQWRQDAQKTQQEQLDELGLRQWMAARDDAAAPPEPA